MNPNHINCGFNVIQAWNTTHGEKVMKWYNTGFGNEEVTFNEERKPVLDKLAGHEDDPLYVLWAVLAYAGQVLEIDTHDDYSYLSGYDNTWYVQILKDWIFKGRTKIRLTNDKVDDNFSNVQQLFAYLEDEGLVYAKHIKFNSTSRAPEHRIHTVATTVPPKKSEQERMADFFFGGWKRDQPDNGRYF